MNDGYNFLVSETVCETSKCEMQAIGYRIWQDKTSQEIIGYEGTNIGHAKLTSELKRVETMVGLIKESDIGLLGLMVW